MIFFINFSRISARIPLCAICLKFGLKYSAFLLCLQDSMYDRTRWHSVAEQQACLQEETRFLLEFLHSDTVSTHTASIEHLQRMARVRLCLDMAADLLVNRVTSAGNLKKPVVFSCVTCNVTEHVQVTFPKLYENFFFIVHEENTLF